MKHFLIAMLALMLPVCTASANVASVETTSSVTMTNGVPSVEALIRLVSAVANSYPTRNPGGDIVAATGFTLIHENHEQFDDEPDRDQLVYAQDAVKDGDQVAAVGEHPIILVFDFCGSASARMMFGDVDDYQAFDNMLEEHGYYILDGSEDYQYFSAEPTDSGPNFVSDYEDLPHDMVISSIPEVNMETGIITVTFCLDGC